MTSSFIVPLLALITMFAAVVFALVSKAKTDARRKDPNAPTSTLAKDGPQDIRPFLKDE